VLGFCCAFSFRHYRVRAAVVDVNVMTDTTKSATSKKFRRDPLSPPADTPHPALRTLRQQPVLFTGTAFSVRGSVVPGLTRVVHSVLPVPKRSHATCPRCRARNATKRHYSEAGLHRPGMRSRKRQRWMTPVSVPSASASSSVADSSEPSALAARPRCGGTNERDHGMLVDSQLTSVYNGQYVRVLDPCVQLVLETVAQYGWRLLATQVPLAIPMLRCATAVDVLCIDKEDQVHLIEIKATRNAGQDVHLMHECYILAPGGPVPASRVVECSWYWQHQFQLWAMLQALRDLGIHVASARVLRSCHLGMFEYVLTEKHERALESMVRTRFALPKA